MAVAKRLPNGYVVLMLSAREAALLSDEVLKPEDFPWQSMESQMVAFSVRGQLRELLETDSLNSLGDAVSELEREMVEQQQLKAQALLQQELQKDQPKRKGRA